MRQYLTGRDVEPPAIAVALEELTATGYLDDARYAQMFAQDKRELEHWGDGRICRALLARGIERDLIDTVLAEANGGSELGRALAILRQRFPQPPSDRRERQRALGVLVRRGYDPELAFDALAAHSRGPG